jgi:hypothetical protein
MSVGIAAALGGGVLSAFGSLYQGKAEAAAQEFNARVSENNAEMARVQAAEEERRVRVGGAKAIGDMRANYGASGIVTSESSALDVLEESAMNVELDALTVRYQGHAQALAMKNEAFLARRAGKQANLMGKVGAASALLGAGASAYSQQSLANAGGGNQQPRWNTAGSALGTQDNTWTVNTRGASSGRVVG